MLNFLLHNATALLWSAWRRRYLVAVPLLLMPLLGLVIGVVSPKKYESYTTILIQEAADQNPLMEDLAVATNLKDRMSALTALLHSRHILSDVALRMEMISTDQDEKEREEVITALSDSLSVKLFGESLIKLSLTSDSPQGMEKLLQFVSIHFVERVIAPQRSAVKNSESFLAEELEQRQKDLQAANQKLAVYKSQFADELPNLHAANMARLVMVHKLLADRRISLNSSKAARDSLQQRLAQTDPIVGKLEEEIVQRLSALALLRSRYTDQHTEVQAALRRLQSLNRELSKAISNAHEMTNDELLKLWNRASSQQVAVDATIQPLLVSQLQKFQDANATVRALEEEVSSLQNEQTSLNARMKAYGEHERRLNELDRDILAKQKIYDELSERYQKAKITGSLGRSEESERVKLIDPPFTPTSPSTPSLKVYLLSSLMAGVARHLDLE